MERNNESWAGFKGELWKKEINVRDFIQNNYTPYTGDDSFLKPSSEKTRKVWNKLTEMFKVEREKGVYDTETKLPQSITTYGPGCGIADGCSAQAWYFPEGRYPYGGKQLGSLRLSSRPNDEGDFHEIP